MPPAHDSGTPLWYADYPHSSSVYFSPSSDRYQMSRIVTMPQPLPENSSPHNRNFDKRFHAYDNHGPQMNAARSRTVYSSSPYERPHHLTSASTSVGARDNQIEIARANAWVKAYRAAAAEKATTVAAAAAVAAADATTRVIAGTPPDAATMARTHSDSAPRLSDKGETFLWGEVFQRFSRGRSDLPNDNTLDRDGFLHAALFVTSEMPFGEMERIFAAHCDRPHATMSARGFLSACEAIRRYP